MTTFNWREVRHLELHEAVVENPNSTSQLLHLLNNVRVAFDGAFLHIDPRPTNQPFLPGDSEFTVHTVPASAVKVIRFPEPVVKPEDEIFS